MIKTYTARTIVSLNVNLPLMGGVKHITFEPMTSGGSYYTTDDEEVQEGLEKSTHYNKWYKLTASYDPEASATKPARKRDVPADRDGEDENAPADKTDDAPADGEMKTVEVSDIAAAKEYLVDTFDLARTSLRSEVKIREAAARHNIKFVGI